MAPLQSFTLGGSEDMLPQEILVLLGVLSCILVLILRYSREAHRASEEAHHHNHHCLLNYWNNGNISIGKDLYYCLLSMPIP